MNANSRRIRRMSRSRKKPTPMNLTSLMDVFTILVFFLLTNSASNEALEAPKSIELPSSVVETKPQETVVVLVTNASTGYAWHQEKLDEDVLRSLCSGSVRQSPLLGSPSDLKWFFEAAEPGETELVLKYYRSWEGPASAVDSFTLNVVVH